MKRLSPYEAAGEGFRLIRRESRAFLVWTGIWFATFSLAAWIVAASRQATQTGPTPANLQGVSESFGPYAWLLIGLFSLVWLVTAVAAFRAVLRPAERSLFFLRLGLDEVRLGGLTVGAFFAAIPFGGAPAYLVLLLMTPFMHAIPTAAGVIGWIGVFLTVGLEIWLGVRLSLIAVETFSERRFHLTAYWPVTEGRFWYLFLTYLFFFLVVLGLLVVVWVVGLMVSGVAIAPVGGRWERVQLLLQAGALTALTAIFWSTASTLFYACQAHAFREIVGEGRAGVPPPAASETPARAKAPPAIRSE